MKIKKFFEKYFGLGTIIEENDAFEYGVAEDEYNGLGMVAEDGEEYKR